MTLPTARIAPSIRVSLAALLMACGMAVGTARAAAPPDAEFASAWPRGVARPWIGPDYWANRLQDWRVEDGRLVCTTAEPRFPLRTVSLLTRSVATEAGTLDLRVVVTPPAGPADASGWAGFVVGAGGPHVDHRLTALVHHRPAEDGGLLAVVDATGLVSFRDNTTRGEKGGGQWSVGGPLAPDEARVLVPGERRAADGGTSPGAIDLRLITAPVDDGRAYRLILRARRADDRTLLSEAVYEDASPDLVDGGLALVSHGGRGPKGPGFAFRDWSATGTKLRAHPERSFGPVLAAQYTLGRGVLKLTAQMGPLGDADSRTARLEVAADDFWFPIETADLAPDSHTFHFRAESWPSERDVRARIVYDLAVGDGRTEPHVYDVTVRAAPADRDALTIASLNCHKVFTGDLRWNHDAIWFPHAELVSAVAHHDPDLLFFAGDQIYEGDLDPAQVRPEDTAILDYLNKWYRWCWAFGSLTRDRPTVTIPDDHDVYHGNLWGAGGKRARKEPGITAQDSGGYKMSPRFVNAVHRTQTGHLPDPYDDAPIGDGYTTYFTTLEYGGVSFAILADRQFKSSPTVAVPAGDVKNGWFRNAEFDPATEADVDGAVLLGPAQLAMLDTWADDWSGDEQGPAWMKVVLSQTIFTNLATLPEKATSGAVLPSLAMPAPGEHPAGQRLAADADSNGWPQTGRRRAVEAFRRAFAINLAGDQHLGSLVQYGLEAWRDAGFAFCSPAIANTWPRRWFPPAPGENREPGAPAYTGDFVDGFGNHMTVWAVANPVRSGHEPARLYDRMPGYGIVHLRRADRSITFECWPRWVDPATDDTQYAGWPRTVTQADNGPPPTHGWLPVIEAPGERGFTVHVVHEATGETQYTLRVDGERFRPPAPRAGTFTVRVQTDEETVRTWAGVRVGQEQGLSVGRKR